MAIARRKRGFLDDADVRKKRWETWMLFVARTTAVACFSGGYGPDAHDKTQSRNKREERTIEDEVDLAPDLDPSADDVLYEMVEVPVFSSIHTRKSGLPVHLIDESVQFSTSTGTAGVIGRTHDHPSTMRAIGSGDDCGKMRDLERARWLLRRYVVKPETPICRQNPSHTCWLLSLRVSTI